MCSRSYIPFKRDGSENYSNSVAVTEQVYKELTAFMVEALANVKVRAGRPFVIGDYGSADGVGSYELIRTFIGFLRNRDGDDLPITVIYEDQPINDFKPIFLLTSGESTDRRGLYEEFKNVFVLASGTSFYQQCLPAKSVDFVFSSLATHWLSKCPGRLEDTIFPVLAKGKVKEMCQKQAAEDWEKFLLLRATELGPGGYMVLISIMTAEEGTEGSIIPSGVFTDLDTVWRSLLADRIITKEEYRNTSINNYLRSEEEFLAPFNCNNSMARKAGLRVMSATKRTIPHTPMVSDKEILEETECYAKGFVNAVKTWTENGLLGGLGNERPVEQRMKIVETFYNRFTKMFTQHPQKLRGSYHLYCMVVQKNDQ